MTHTNPSFNLHEAKLRKEDESPEFRRKRAAALAWIAERRITAAGDVESRVDQLISLDSEDFVTTLVNANRVLTKTARDEFDTNYMIPFNNIVTDDSRPGYLQVLPHPEDKNDLLLCLHELALHMRETNKSGGHTAAVIGYGVNLIHPFKNGNGRTARMVHDALIYGTEDSGERFPHLADDSVENTNLMNPELIESYVYEQMQLECGTHQLQGSELVPHIKFAAQPSTMRNLSLRTSDMNGSLSSPFDHTLLAISHPKTSPILAYFMASEQKTLAVGDAIATYQGQVVFDLDTFMQRATADDWNAMHQYARSISVKYAFDAMHILAAHPSYGPELLGPVNTVEQGVVSLPISQLIQQLAQQKLRLAPWPSET